jgi:membrane-associated protease RseP (regulator of RpoE activity)
MKRKFAMWLMLSTLVLLVCAGYGRSQEAPEPPDEPEAALGALKAQLVGMERTAWLGVALKDVTAEKVRDLKLPGEYGALVLSVDTEGAAAKAGMLKGDVIVEFGGERVRSVAQLRRLIRETPAGRTVSLQVVRDGQTRTLSAKLQPQPETGEFHGEVPEIHIPEMHISPSPRLFDYYRGFNFPFEGGRPSLGISGDELSSQLATFFGVKQGKGVLIREVVVGSPAAKAGLKAGDVIVAVDGRSVATVAELRQALEIKPGEEKRKLNLTVVRDHHEQTVPVELEQQGLGEREKVAARFGADAGEWQRAEAEAKAQMAAAQLTLKDAQKQLSDKQRLLSDKMRQAAEEYRRAIQRQLKLQFQQQLDSRARQSETI